ncbi:MAG: DUF4349 domain-containing protein [Clostridiaceae bacterium]|jgi:hypothetical protein|nr:DUF4349 domain-containing protein [Clostridiaceae bacterium]
MKKRLLGLLLVVTLLLSVAAGCGSGKSDTAYDSKSTAVSGGASNGRGYGSVTAPAGAPAANGEVNMDTAYEEADSLAGIGSLSVDITNPILDERKIIRSADLTIEVDNFDTAFSNIETIITGIGFIQETNINTDRLYVDNEVKFFKRGTIVLRVARDKFDSVLNKLRGIGDVYNYTTHGEDVTEQYFDVESRLRLLKMEQEKIEAYVAKLNDLDQIFKAESKLTEIRYQIESLTGKLNKLSSLVELSTITINLNEKRPGYDAKPKTYGDRLLDSLKQSLLDVVEFLGDLLLFIVAALPALVLLGLFILLGVALYRKFVKNRRPETGGLGSTAMPGKQAVPPAPTKPETAQAKQEDPQAKQEGPQEK